MNDLYIGYQQFNSELVLEIGKFSIWWNMFESQKFDCSFSYEKANEFANKITNDKDNCFKKFAAELKERAMNIFDGQDDCLEKYIKTKLYPTTDCRARITKREKEECANKVLKFISSDGQEYFEGALLAIYRIRNNMFHGLKDEFRIELFRAINNVFKNIFYIN